MPLLIDSVSQTGDPVSQEIVTLDTAKKYLRVTTALEDDKILDIIKKSISKIETVTGRTLFNTEFVHTFSTVDFPYAFQKYPVNSVVGFTAIDEFNNTTVINSDFYTLEKEHLPALLLANTAGIIDQICDDLTGDKLIMKIRFLAGYGAFASDLPDWSISSALNIIAYRFAVAMGGDSKGQADGILNAIDKELLQYRLEI